MPAGSHTRCRTSVVERHPTHPLGDQRQHDVAAVAVGEAFAGRELRRVAIEYGEVLLGRRELVHGNRQQVVGEVEILLLVQVVADARPMGEEVLDGHLVVDQRQVAAEHRTGRGRRARATLLDQADDGQRRQALRAARGREAGVDLVGDLVALGARIRSAFANSTWPARSTRTTPENAVSAASVSSSFSSPVIAAAPRARFRAPAACGSCPRPARSRG